MQQSTATLTDIVANQAAPLGAHVLPPPPGSPSHFPLNIRLTDKQLNSPPPPPENRQLKTVINEKIRNKQLFYGIEIMAHSYEANTTLDYNSFGPLLPLFTSIVWMSMDYWKVKNIHDVEAIQLAHKLHPNVTVMPHFSCFRLKEERLRQFLNLNFTNVLAIRGDRYRRDQSYKHSSELVEAIRKLKGDAITIGVGGYPDGHPECSSIGEDMENLVKKVSAGADFVITQICFSSQSIIDFIKRARAQGIKVPILVGIFVPDNYRMLEVILRITKINMPPEELADYRRHAELDEDKFTEYAVSRAVQMIDAILHSQEVEVYGLQFFSMNKFHNIPKVLQKINMSRELLVK